MIKFHPGPRLASIVLDRPPLNIINVAMIDEISAAWDDIDDLDAQVVVISSAGDRAFSAGIDVADHVPDKVQPMLRKFHDLLERIYRSKRVTIAAVRGYTLGGGAELAMVCDLVVGADDTLIGQPEIDLGCFPPAAAAYLPRAIGFHKASELVLLGKPIAAAEALGLGLLNRVVPVAALSEAVDEYVETLLAKSSAVLALSKQVLREGMDHRFRKALRRTEKLYVKELVKTEDAAEGIQAFLGKRPPVWKNQ